MGTISTEKVYLKFAVLLWISEDSNCSDAFDLVKISNRYRKLIYDTHFIGATPVKKSNIFRAWLF